VPTSLKQKTACGLRKLSHKNSDYFPKQQLNFETEFTYLDFKAMGLVFIKLNRKGCVRKHAVATWGAWEPPQHLLEDGGKTRKPVLR
jgi:hypothetical protein